MALRFGANCATGASKSASPLGGSLVLASHPPFQGLRPHYPQLVVLYPLIPTSRPDTVEVSPNYQARHWFPLSLAAEAQLCSSSRKFRFWASNRSATERRSICRGRDCGGGGAERLRQVEHLRCDYVGAGRAVCEDAARREDGGRDLCGDARAEADRDGGGVADAGGPGGV